MIPLIATLLAIAAPEAVVPQPSLCEQIASSFKSAAGPPPIPRDGRVPKLRITVEYNHCHGWEVVDLSRLDGDRQFDWVMRRTRMDRHGTTQLDLAQSSSCPRMASMLARLDAIPVNLSVAPYRGGPPIPFSNSFYTFYFSLAAQSEGTFANVSIDTFHGPLTEWKEQGFAELEGCWEPQPGSV
jgi:hypothetical protein